MKKWLLAVLVVAGCSNPSAGVPWKTPTAAAATRTASGLGYTVEAKAPAGAAVAKAGDAVRVTYAGWLTNGKLFDSSFSRNKPFAFTLGEGSVIAGWDEGVAGMAVGERRKLVVPAALGYGAAGTTGIPGNATLIFVVELVSID